MAQIAAALLLTAGVPNASSLRDLGAGFNERCRCESHAT